MGVATVKAGTAVVLALFLAGALVPVAASHGQAVPARAPSALSISVMPQVLPADSKSYPALVISLVDSGGNPTFSLSDLTVYLSSSNESAASVPTTATLPAGHSYVQVEVTTTGTPGKTEITAASSGLAAKSVSISTAVPLGGARALGLFVSPSGAILGLQGPDATYVVELEGAGGNPGTSGSDTGVVITSSNSSLLAAPIKVTIPAGASLAYGQIAVNKTGGSVLTALASQFVTASADLKVVSATPTLTVAVSPSEIFIRNDSEVTVAVQVLGMPVEGVNIALTTNGGTVSPAGLVTNAAGTGYAVYRSDALGAFVIYATAVDPQLGLNLTGNQLIVVARAGATGTSTGQSGSLSVAPYLPFIVVAVVVVVVVLLVRWAIGRRKGVVEDEEPFPEPATRSAK